MNAVVFLPSLNRTKLLKRFFESYKQTKATIPVWVLVDSKDLEKNNDGYGELELPDGCKLINTGSAVSMGDKIRWAYKDPMYSEIIKKLDWVSICNDDHKAVTEEWDQKFDKLIDGTNMVSCNDGNYMFGVRVVGLTAFSTPLIEAFGFPMFPRNLQHLYIDDVFKAIGESTGCWLETNKINMPHLHAFKGDMEQDETFKKVYAPGSWEYDAKEWKHFLEQDFKDVCARVLKLRSHQNLDEKMV